MKKHIISDFVALLKLKLVPKFTIKIEAEEDHVLITIPEELSFSSMIKEIDAVVESNYNKILYTNSETEGSKIMIYVKSNRHSASLVYPNQ